MFAPGTYHGYLQSAVTTEAKTGNLQIALVFAVRNQWNGSEWEDVNEEERRVYLSLTDAASPYTEKKLAALGFNGDFMDPQFDDAVANEGVDLKCTASTYNGKATEKWELAGWGGVIEPAAESKVKRLNARWNAGASAAQSPTKSSPAPAKTAAPSKETPPPPPPATATRDSVWEKLCALWSETKSEDELLEIWQKAIAEQGKPEAEFTAEDWAAVQEAVKIPF